MDNVREARELIITSCHHGGKVATCGNGGSAADAEHIVGKPLKFFGRRRVLSDDLAGRIESVVRIQPVSS